MKNKLFFLLGLPAVWFVVAMLAYQPAADKLYVLAVAPSMWLFFWDGDGEFGVKVQVVQCVGMLMMFLVGLFLSMLNFRPRTIMITSGIVTCMLWLALVITFSESIAIQKPGAVFVWVLCCFNFSLSLLPFLLVPVKLVVFIKQKTQKR